MKRRPKKNQFKAQFVQNRPKGTENDLVDQIRPNEMKVDWVDLIGSNATKVDIIGPNSNCLIFRENKLFSTNFREQIIHTITKQLFIHMHHVSLPLVHHKIGNNETHSQLQSYHIIYYIIKVELRSHDFAK